MTLPTTGPITLGDVLAELRIQNPSRALPVALGDADVRALAGVASGPVSLSDLRGKTSYVAMTGSVPDVDGGGTDIDPSNNYTVDVPVSLTMAGGRAPFSYAWSKLSGNGSVIAVNATSTIVRFAVSKAAVHGTVLSAVVQCAVTDAVTSMTRSGTVTLTLY